MIVWTDDMGRLALENQDFRRVLATGTHSQVMLMNIRPGEDAGKEIHPWLDEFVHIRAGEGRVSVGRSEQDIEETHDVSQGCVAFIPGGYWHNIENTGVGELKLFVLCAPPAYPEGSVQSTKHEARPIEENEAPRGRLEHTRA